MNCFLKRCNGKNISKIAISSLSLMLISLQFIKSETINIQTVSSNYSFCTEFIAKNGKKFNIRVATSVEDELKNSSEKILNLFKTVAQTSEFLAYTTDEVTADLITDLIKTSINDGLLLLVEAEGEIVALIKAYYTLKVKQFMHVLGCLFIMVHPDYQHIGIGKALFLSFLENIKSNRPDILKIKLIVYEKNINALKMYKELGFVVEGEYKDEIVYSDGSFGTSISMSWRNPNFKTPNSASFNNNV